MWDAVFWGFSTDYYRFISDRWSLGAGLTYDQETETRAGMPDKIVNTMSVNATVAYAVTEHFTLTTGLGQGFADDNNPSGSFGFAQGSLGTALAFGLSVPLRGAWDLNGSASYEYDISENEQIIAFDFSVSFGF